MARINTNVPAIQSINRLQRNYDNLAVRLERLGTGLRINRGADDPAGLIASERLRLESRAIQQSIENSARANNVISTTETALGEVNALLLDLQTLIVEAANKGALTSEEVAANQLQIDSILTSIDRIANTTTFAGKKLLDGQQEYQLSSVPTAALGAVSVFAARQHDGAPRTVTVSVTQSAQTAQVVLLGTSTSGTSTTMASTVEIRGNLGTEVLAFASGSTLGEIAAAINAIKDSTGVTATASGGGGGASALMLNSIEVGSDAFVSVTPLNGNFVAGGNTNTEIRDIGQDATVLVDGQTAFVRGLRADIRTSSLNARFQLTQEFGQTLSSASFSITGGGTLFQITPEISPNGQVHLGMTSIRSTKLGNPVVGRLSSLHSGGANDLSSQQFLKAQEILKEAIDQVSSFRGRLGNLQRNTIDSNVNSQRIVLENIIASESIIRDADMAEEVSALTRAQILVQSTQATLQVANTLPNLVLSLLG